MSAVPPTDRFRLYERSLSGAGPDRKIADFPDPVAAFAELNRLMAAYPEMYCGHSPTHRVLVKDRTASS